jgi:preprotein translocase subunit SecD
LLGLFLVCALLTVTLGPLVTGAQPVKLEIADATVGIDLRTKEPIVTFRLTDASRKVFAEFTSKNVGRPMAIIVDGRVMLKPVIREPILGGVSQLVGKFTAAEATVLAERLASGKATLEIEISD